MKEIPQTKNKHVTRLLKQCGITKRAKRAPKCSSKQTGYPPPLPALCAKEV